MTQDDMVLVPEIVQVPALRLAFLPLGDPRATDESSDGGDKAPRLAIQAYPGAYTYAAMASFLTSFADMLG